MDQLAGWRLQNHAVGHCMIETYHNNSFWKRKPSLAPRKNIYILGDGKKSTALAALYFNQCSHGRTTYYISINFRAVVFENLLISLLTTVQIKIAQESMDF
jgi:hypothetical protein